MAWGEGCSRDGLLGRSTGHACICTRCHGGRSHHACAADCWEILFVRPHVRTAARYAASCRAAPTLPRLRRRNARPRATPSPCNRWMRNCPCEQGTEVSSPRNSAWVLAAKIAQFCQFWRVSRSCPGKAWARRVVFSLFAPAPQKTLRIQIHPRFGRMFDFRNGRRHA